LGDKTCASSNGRTSRSTYAAIKARLVWRLRVVICGDARFRSDLTALFFAHCGPSVSAYYAFVRYLTGERPERVSSWGYHRSLRPQFCDAAPPGGVVEAPSETYSVITARRRPLRRSPWLCPRCDLCASLQRRFSRERRVSSVQDTATPLDVASTEFVEPHQRVLPSRWNWYQEYILSAETICFAARRADLMCRAFDNGAKIATPLANLCMGDS